MNNLTGFEIVYKDDTIIKEKNDYIDSNGVKRLTNWHEVDLKQIKELRLLSKGKVVAKINNDLFPKFDEKDYFYFSVGKQDLSRNEIERVGRKIGAKSDQFMFHYFLDEKSDKVIKREFII